MAGCPCRSRSCCAVPPVVPCDHAERQARSRGIIKQICVTRRLTKPVKLSGVQGSYAVVGRGSYSRADGPEHGRARSLPPGVRPPAKSYRDPFTTWSLTMTNRLFKRARAFARHLNRLRDRRRSSREAHLPVRRQRQSLTPRQRAAVLAKTGGRCHICGGKIRRASLWHA